MNLRTPQTFCGLCDLRGEMSPGERFRRRGNALIMAVTLTAMLAIIGSSFVLVTRLERQAVRSFANVQGIDEVQDYVIRKIQATLAADVVTPNGNVSVDRLRSESGGTANTAYEPWDAPVTVPAPVDGDRWLAAIAPTDQSGAGTGPWRWPQVSELFGDAGAAFNAGPALPNVAPGVPADADGDGIADSFWRQPLEVQVIDGKTVNVAVRIIDNCGMLNLNTAVSMDPAVTGDYNSYGTLPTQLGVIDLLGQAQPAFTNNVSVATAPTAMDEAFWLLRARIGGFDVDGQYQLLPAYGGAIPSNWLTYYTEWLLRFCEAPQARTWYIEQTMPKPWTGTFPAPEDLGRYARLFGVGDELALRNRFLLKGAGTSRIEGTDTKNVFAGHTPNQGLWYAIGDEPGDVNGDGVISLRRRAPFSDVQSWAMSLFGVTPAAAAAFGLTADPRHDIRHQITTYSFDRTMRPRPMNPANPTQWLDDPSFFGPLRQVDINQTVTKLLQYGSADTNHISAAKKLILAVAYALADSPADMPTALDRAAQYVANLVDYLDQDDSTITTTISTLTAYNSNVFNTGSPAFQLSRPVYGYERQPFISEVFSRVAKVDDGNGGFKVQQVYSAVELCNPYDKAISLEGWQLAGAVVGPSPGLPVTLSGDVPARLEDAATGIWRPGRLIIATTGTPPTPNPNEGGNATWVFPPSAFQFDQGNTGGLQLQRPILAGASGGTYVVVDSVGDAVMQKVLGKGSDAPNDNRQRDFSLERGVRAWRWARNEFDYAPSDEFAISGNPTTDVNGLGDWLSKPHPRDINTAVIPPAPFAPGMSLPVADRVLVPYVPVPLNSTLKVQGWFEVSRPTFIGNGTTPSDAITNTIAARVTLPVPNAQEGNVRFNLGEATTVADEWKNKARKLFEATGFFARCDDGFDNETGAAAPTPQKLAECRIPGRINVNTAPEAVLRAVFPALAEPSPDASLSPPVDPNDWTSCVNMMAGWFAKAVVYMRTENGPFRGLDDFVLRLDAFNNPSVGSPAQPLIPDLPQQARVMRLSWMAKRAVEVVKGGGKTTTVRNAGDPFMGYFGNPTTYDATMDYGDFEERDWLFGRMANLLTVRSDTFTAYILIRVTGQNNEASDRRVMAIFDRSNVFLPPAMARPPNAVNDSQDPLTSSDPNSRDRLYVTPKVVAVQPVPDLN